jgi:alkaline phosphatase
VIVRPSRLVPFALALACPLAGLADAQDKLKTLQAEAIAHKGDKVQRAYHFGSQGAGGVFSNHTSHSNRLIPVYTFGRKVDLGAVTGSNSAYRDASKVKDLYGFLPERTVNPEAEYADHSRRGDREVGQDLP